MTQVNGHVEPTFEAVREAFRHSFATDGPSGAALAIWNQGRPVVDLWGGQADIRSQAPWQADTIAPVFSCTKGLMSILVAQLVQEGLLSYDEPAARVWPEFGQAGKHRATVGDLMAHRAGLMAPVEPLSTADILDWDVVTSQLAAQAPQWEPGTAYGYHTITHGWLAGELVRRVTGKSPGTVFAERIATPLQADAWIGLPGEHASRTANAWSAPSASGDGPPVSDPDEIELLTRSITLGNALPVTLVGDGTGFNDPLIQAAEIPGAGGIATARALAAIWSATVVETDGVRLLDDEVVKEATRERSAGAPVVGIPAPWARWGAGFQLDSPARRLLTDASFGHDGAGGQVAFADPLTGTGFAFITNRMERGDIDMRAARIIDALREVLIHNK